MARICWAALLLKQKVCSGTICYHLPAKICLGFAQNRRIYSSVLVNMVSSDCGSRVPAAGVGARTYYLNRSQPPLLSAMVRIVYGATEDAALLRSGLPVTLPGPDHPHRERLHVPLALLQGSYLTGPLPLDDDFRSRPTTTARQHLFIHLLHSHRLCNTI